MGQDVAFIGLGHKLPIDEPHEMVKMLAERMQRNIKLVARNDYHFFYDLMMLTSETDSEWIELDCVCMDDTDDYLMLIYNDYQAIQIQKLIGKERINRILYADSFSELCFKSLQEPDRILYELEDNDVYYRIYEHNVALSTYVIERWHWWSKEAMRGPHCCKAIHDYRRAVYEEATIFGCDEVMICSDQGTTIALCWSLEMTPDELKHYAKSNLFLENHEYPCGGLSKEEWLHYGKQIYFPDYLSGKTPLLQGKEFIAIVYDDFSDFKH